MSDTKTIRYEAESGPGGGADFEVGPKRLIIGSDPDCDVVLTDSDVSGEHASMKQIDGHTEIHDLGSRTGTYVNGNKIAAPTLVGMGDEVKIGSTVLRAAPATAATEPHPSGAGPAPTKQPAGEAVAAGTGGGRISGRVRSLGAKSAVIAIAAAVAVAALAAYFLTRSDEPQPLSASEVIEVAKPSTLMVISRSSGFSPITGTSGGIFSAGTAWVWDAEQGLVVTAAHVVTSGSTFQVGYDRTGLRPATIVGVDVAHDLAVLRVSPADLPGLTTLDRASGDDVQQGDTVYALGYPGNSTSATNFLGTPFQSTEGTISATTDVQTPVDTDVLGFPNNQNAELLLSDLYQTTAALNSGNSGGPLVDEFGHLVGDNVAGGGGAESQGYAIPVSTIDDVVPNLVEGNSVGWLGFGVDAISSQAAGQLFGIETGPGGPTAAAVEGGLLVTSVVRDTPADQSRLGTAVSQFARHQQFLLITAVNNQPVTTMEQYVNAVSQLQSGEQVEIDLSCIYPDLTCIPIGSVKMRVP